jgi:hypothetical protein
MAKQVIGIRNTMSGFTIAQKYGRSIAGFGRRADIKPEALFKEGLNAAAKAVSKSPRDLQD